MSGNNEPEFVTLQRDCLSAAAKLSHLEKLMGDMNSECFSEELLNECPELAKKVTENEKLKYRIDILKRSSEKCENGSSFNSLQCNEIDGPEKQPKKSNKKNFYNKKFPKQPKKVIKNLSYTKIVEYGNSFLTQFKDIFSNIIKDTFEEITDPAVIVETTNPKYGDYQFNSAMAISKKLSSLGHEVSPRDVAIKLAEKLPKLQLVDKIEVAGPGFINLFLNRDEIGNRISEIYKNGVILPKVEKRRVIVDFPSPNIAKEMHVGHLRPTIIGDSISRLFELMGFEVLRLNHIGDWGTPVGMLIAHIQDRFPDYLEVTPPIGSLQALYKESKKRFDDKKNPEFKAHAHQCVVKLQSYDKNIVKPWNMICDVTREDSERIFRRLSIETIERGESFYQSRMVDLVKELTEQGVLEEDKGMKILFAKEFPLVPLIIVKSDKGFTYDTSDLTAIKQRLFEEKADWIIYVVDAGQSLHFDTIFAMARDLSFYDPQEKRVEHVGFGVVLGEDKQKFKTRSGDTVRLTDLLDEGVIRAKAKMEAKMAEKSSDTYENMSEEEFQKIYEAVAFGCIKYADLSQNRRSDYVFSFDKMLDDRGNTAVYLLYAYARIRSIARKAGISRDELVSYVENLKGSFPLEHPAEFKLAKQILKFSDCILMVLDSLLMHQVCEYVYNLTTTFHDFYNECYAIHKDREGNITLYHNRLILCEITADVMAICFKILGIRPIERM